MYIGISYLYILKHTYIHIHIYTHIHTHIHAYIHTSEQIIQTNNMYICQPGMYQTLAYNITALELKSLLETAQDAGLSESVRAINSIGLHRTISRGNYTLFLPSDEAFKELVPPYGVQADAAVKLFTFFPFTFGGA